MPTTPRSQAQLARDPNFLRRLESLLLSEAGVVAGEATSVTNHVQRRALAQAIITNSAGQTATLATTICNATNLTAANTTWDFEMGAAVTDATDAAIRSQISTLWNIMAGV